MKKYTSCVFSLVGLIASYLTLRFPLYSLHGMKDWPLLIFLIGGIIVVISGIVFKKKALPVFAFVGYVVGFVAGYVFQYDYGQIERHNTLWIIWTCVWLVIIFIGIAVEVICRKRKAN